MEGQSEAIMENTLQGKPQTLHLWNPAAPDMLPLGSRVTVAGASASVLVYSCCFGVMISGFPFHSQSDLI